MECEKGIYSSIMLLIVHTKVIQESLERLKVVESEKNMVPLNYNFLYTHGHLR